MTFSDYSRSRKSFQGHYLANVALDSENVRSIIVISDFRLEVKNGAPSRGFLAIARLPCNYELLVSKGIFSLNVRIL